MTREPSAQELAALALAVSTVRPELTPDAVWGLARHLYKVVLACSPGGPVGEEDPRTPQEILARIARLLDEAGLSDEEREPYRRAVRACGKDNVEGLLKVLKNVEENLRRREK